MSFFNDLSLSLFHISSGPSKLTPGQRLTRTPHKKGYTYQQPIYQQPNYGGGGGCIPCQQGQGGNRGGGYGGGGSQSNSYATASAGSSSNGYGKK